MVEFPTFMGSWPWPWRWIRAWSLPFFISHRVLPVYQISSKSKKLFVDGRTDGRTDGNLPPIVLGRLPKFGSRPKKTYRYVILYPYTFHRVLASTSFYLLVTFIHFYFYNFTVGRLLALFVLFHCHVLCHVVCHLLLNKYVSGNWPLSIHAGPISTRHAILHERCISSVTFTSAHLHANVYMRVSVTHALADSSDFGLLGEQSSQNFVIQCLGRR